MKKNRLLFLMLALLTCTVGAKADEVVIGSGTSTNNYLPIYPYYDYSLSQQIYTSDEIGTAGTINSISFFNASPEKVRKVELYMAHTDKESFSSNTDWILVSDDDLVFSGTVTFTENDWTTIELNNPFTYNGVDNLTVTVNDDTGSYVESARAFRTFAASNQALFYYRDNNPIDPSNPWGGNLVEQKNQIKLDITQAGASECARPRGLALTSVEGNIATVSWTTEAGTAYNLRYKSSTDEDYTVIEGATSPYTLENLSFGSQYTVQVQTACSATQQSDWSTALTFITDCCLPESMCEITYELTDSYGDGWNGNAIRIIDKVTGLEVANLTIDWGSSSTGSVSLCDGRTYQFEWVSGTFPSECSYTFIDANGEEIFSGSGTLTTYEYQMSCTVHLNKKPTDVTVSPTPTTAQLTWTGTSDSYEVKYRLSSTVFFDDFENGLGQWTIYTVGESPNTDGWTSFNPANMGSGTVVAHSGNNVASAWSWSSDAYDADNWLVTPQVELKGTLSFWVNTAEGWPDSYEVLLSTGGNAIDDFTATLQPMAEAAGGWNEVSIDLSEYNGQPGYIAIHHVSTDCNFLFIDDFSIEDASEVSPWSTLTTTECQVTLEDLTPGTYYDYQIIGKMEGDDDAATGIALFTTLSENAKMFIADGDWSNPDCWSDGIGNPTVDDNVYIYANAVIGGGITAEASKVSIFDGSITLQDGSQLIHDTDGLELTIEKDITGYGENTTGNYYMLATPFKESIAPANVENMLNTTYEFYRFLPTMSLEWRHYDLTSFTMGISGGYLYANEADQTLSWTGTTYSSKENILSIDLSYSSNNNDFNGWALVGNPFTCNAYLFYEGSATYYKMNASGDGYDGYQDYVMLKPGEACLMHYSEESTLYFISYNYFDVEPEAVETVEYLPILPTHGQGSKNIDASPLLQLADDGIDNSSILAGNAGTITNVQLVGRKLFKDNSWNTLCLPFDLTLSGSVLAGATVKPLENATMEGTMATLTFGSPVSAIEAGVPYIIKWESGSDIENPTFNKVELKGVEAQTADFEYVKFIGYYDAFDIDANDTDIFYMKADNTLAHTAKPRTLKAFRTYFKLSKNGTGVNTFNLNFGDGESTATAIRELVDERANEGYYNLQGVKMNDTPTQKGVYISNGKKVVVK